MGRGWGLFIQGGEAFKYESEKKRTTTPGVYPLNRELIQVTVVVRGVCFSSFLLILRPLLRLLLLLAKQMNNDDIHRLKQRGITRKSSKTLFFWSVLKLNNTELFPLRCYHLFSHPFGQINRCFCGFIGWLFGRAGAHKEEEEEMGHSVCLYCCVLVVEAVD